MDRKRLRDLRIGFLIPQQSLRKLVQKVFRKTSGLDLLTVLTAFDVGESEQDFDLLTASRKLNGVFFTLLGFMQGRRVWTSRLTTPRVTRVAP